MLEGVGHGLVGGFGCACAVLHLGQNAVELVRTAGCQREGTGASFHAGPQACKCGTVAAHAVVQDLEHVAKALALSVQLGKALTGLLLQDFAHRGTGIAQLVEHGLGVGGGFGGCDTVGRHDCQTAGQVFHADTVGGGQWDHLAHAGGQLVHAGFAEVLGSQQHIRHMGGLIGAHSVCVQGRGEDINRRTAGCKTGSRQLGSLPGKGYGIGSVLSCTDGLIGCLCDVRRSNAHLAGHGGDLVTELLRRQLAGVRNGGNLCKGRFKCRADADR